MWVVIDKFFLVIVSFVDKIFYGMCFIVKVLKDLLYEKFFDVGEDELLKIIGNLFYYWYMNLVIVVFDVFDIIDLLVGG